MTNEADKQLDEVKKVIGEASEAINTAVDQIEKIENTVNAEEISKAFKALKTTGDSFTEKAEQLYQKVIANDEYSEKLKKTFNELEDAGITFKK